MDGNEILKDHNELLGKMIEYQIQQFDCLGTLQEEYKDLHQEYVDLQEVYRVQCVTNAHLIEQLKRINEFVIANRYISCEDLMAMLHLDEEPDDFTADDLSFGQKESKGDALEILSKEMEEMAK